MSRLRALVRARLAYGKQLAGAVLWYGIPVVVDRLAARLETKPDPDDLLPEPDQATPPIGFGKWRQP